MGMLFVFISLLFILFYLWHSRKKKCNQIEDYLAEFNAKVFVAPKTTIMNMSAFNKQTLYSKMKSAFIGLVVLIGDKAVVKIGLFYSAIYAISMLINNYLFQGDIVVVALIVSIVATFFVIQLLHQRRENEFKACFPDALSLLISAVSAGDSITHAIDFVGVKLDNVVGHEFKRISERLMIGEAPEQVLKKSCQMFPYTEYFFFVVTLRANMNRGGQLKDILQRINRIMFESYAIEKKKLSLTSEARASAKIVGAIPVIFIIILKFISPENFDFVVYDPAGKPILYYVIISEFLGMGIIRMLMKGVG